MSKKQGVPLSWLSLDIEDLRILRIIEKKGKLGTLELSKEVGIAPKNLINRFKKYQRLNLLVKDTIPVKPKGRKRIWWINAEVLYVLRNYEKLFRDLKLLSEGKSPILKDYLDKNEVSDLKNFEVLKQIEEKPKKQELILEGSLDETEKLDKEAEQSGYDFSKTKYINIFIDVKAGSPKTFNFAKRLLQENNKNNPFKTPENTLTSFGFRISNKGKDRIRVCLSTLEPIRIKIMKEYRDYPNAQILVPKLKVQI